MNTVLALGSHCDDIEIGCGGTLIKHRDNGDEIYLAVLKSNEYITAPPELRAKEQRVSCTELKTKGLYTFMEKDHIEYVVKCLDVICPTILYFPFENDYHQDHVFASKVGFAVARNVQITVLRYLTTTSHSYYPNYLSVIDIEKKKELVSVFKSQMERKPKFMEIMEAQNRFFGSLIPGNGHYAEGFCVHRIVQF